MARLCQNSLTRGQGLNSKFSTVVRHEGDLGPRPRWLSPLVLFFYLGCVLMDLSPPSSRVASIAASSSCRVNLSHQAVVVQG